jgi:cell division transport system permease protein
LLDKIEFLIGESLRVFRKNGLMAFAAISTVAISIFLIGGLGYAYYTLSNYAQRTFPTQFTMRVILKDGTTKDEIIRTINQIREMAGVERAVLIPKEKAYPRFIKEMGLPGLAEEKNVPIPDMFQVTLSDISEENSSTVGAQIQAMPAVDSQNGVRYMEAEQRFIDQLLNLLRVLGSVVGGLLFATAGVLIHNAIRLTIVSRRLEIRVMQLVGASRFTIQLPFLFEGIVQGAIGGAVAGFLLYMTNQLLAQAIVGFDVFGTLPELPVWPIIGMLVAAGAVYGFFSSLMALSAPLRYR